MAKRAGLFVPSDHPNGLVLGQAIATGLSWKTMPVIRPRTGRLDGSDATLKEPVGEGKHLEGVTQPLLWQRLELALREPVPMALAECRGRLGGSRHSHRPRTDSCRCRLTKKEARCHLRTLVATGRNSLRH